MGWLIALGIVAVLAVLPLGASVIYDENGPLVRIIAGPVKLQVFPMKKKAKPKKEKPKKEKAKKQKPAKAASAETKAKKQKPQGDPDAKGGSILDFWPFVGLIFDFLGDLRRKLRLDWLKLHLTMAGDDPCDLAVNYGKANASLAALMSQLDRLFVIRHQEVTVSCDFAGDATTISARLDLTITLGRIISLVVCYGIRALKTYLSIQKKRKGGADL